MENWRFVEGFENYLVSNTGKIMSLPVVSKIIDGYNKGSNQKPGKILKPRALPHGHQQVALTKDGKKHWKYVHRIVAEAWLKRNKNVDIVMHLDDDPSNNSVENLKWGTQLENVRWVDKDGAFMNMGKDTNGKAILVYKEIQNLIKQTGMSVKDAFTTLGKKYNRSFNTINHWYYKGKAIIESK